MSDWDGGGAGDDPHPTSSSCPCAEVGGTRYPLSLHLLPEAMERVKTEIEDTEMQGGPKLKFFEAW